MEKKNEVFGKRLRILRDRKGFNQEQIAKAIGISRASYSHYETNRVEPDLEIIRLLSEFHNVSTDYLLGKTDQPQVIESDEKAALIEEMARRYPDADIMFDNLAGMTVEQLKEVDRFIRFTLQKDD